MAGLKLPIPCLELSMPFALQQITAEHPEIEIRQARVEIQSNKENSEKASERQAEEQEKSGGEPNKGVLSEEFCISCMDIPEEQRKGMILEIQQVAERLLKSHGVINKPGDLLKGEWFLKLQKPKFEKKLVFACLSISMSK